VAGRVGPGSTIDLTPEGGAAGRPSATPSPPPARRFPRSAAREDPTRTVGPARPHLAVAPDPDGVGPMRESRRVVPIGTLVRRDGLTGTVRAASAQADRTGPGSDHVLPVLPALRELLPAGGLRRGSTVAVLPGVTSVLLALLAGPSAGGSWCAVVGLPALGALAAAELGVALDRLALVPNPGPDWPAVVGALLDGFDVVVAAPAGPVAGSVASRLAARARQRGSVLVPYARWGGADLVLESPGGGWQGLDGGLDGGHGGGHGVLTRRELVITARGRGAAARPRAVTVLLPDGTGGLAPGTPTRKRILEAVS
jgi:hypothetical protein